MQFGDIPGHDAVKSSLLSTCKEGRIPHAILFHGPEGNGAVALGLALVSYLLCSNRSETDSCGECDSCSKTRSFIHPDVHFSFPVINLDGSKISDTFIADWRKLLKSNPFFCYEDWMDEIKGKDDQNKQGNISAEECREIIRKLSLKSYEGGKKFMLIWLPEFLGLSGNILLKLLEEPPQDTHFLLIAEDLNQVLPTILSRTQLINIRAFSKEELGEYLMQKHELNEADAAAIAFLSRGNLSLALHLLHEEDTEYTENMQQWLRLCYNRNMSEINNWVNQLAVTGREKIKQFLENSLYVFGECMHCRFIEDHEPRVPANNQKFVRDISKILNENKIERIYFEVNNTIMHIERNANPKISLFNLSVTLRNILLEK